MSDKTITKKNEYTNCGGCKNTKCFWQGWKWFSPQANLYCRSQFLWYLENKTKYFDMRVWPENPLIPQSNYTDPAIKPTFKVNSEKVTDFAIECEIRLEACGEDGVTLLEEVESWGENLTVSIPYSYLSTAAKHGLNYCSGKSRRLTPYAVWKAKQKQKAKKV